jgi:uncharacterized membrane protein (DUF485 family)
MDFSHDVWCVIVMRARTTATLTLAMAIIYFGFMTLFAFNKPFLATEIMPGLTMCIVLGPLVILSGIAFSLVYVLWANGTYDDAVRRIVDGGAK